MVSRSAATLNWTSHPRCPMLGPAMRSDVAVAHRRELESSAFLRLAPDQHLVEQVRAGSDRAFEALFDRHRLPVLAFCRRMLGSPEEAEDAVQLTFITAYRDLLGSERPIMLRPWLYGIARHRCLSALRMRRELPVYAVPEPAGDHLGAAVATRDDLRAIFVDITGLPADQRAALVLAELGDLSHEQIARILDCRRDKVKALVFQARTALAVRRAAREAPCGEVREQLATLRGGALRRAALRHHLGACPGCRAFYEEVRLRRRLSRALLPAIPGLGLKRAALGALFGSTGGAGGAAVTLGTGGLAATALAAIAIQAGGLGAAVAPAGNGGDVARIAGSPDWVTAVTARGLMPTTAPPWRGRAKHAPAHWSRQEASATLPAPDPPQAPDRPLQTTATGNGGAAATPQTADSGDRTENAGHDAVANSSATAEVAAPAASTTPPKPTHTNAQPNQAGPPTSIQPPATTSEANPPQPPAAAEPFRPPTANAQGTPAPRVPSARPPDTGRESPAATSSQPTQRPDSTRQAQPTERSDVARPLQPSSANASKANQALQAHESNRQGPPAEPSQAPDQPQRPRANAQGDPPRPVTPTNPSDNSHADTPAKPSQATQPHERNRSGSPATRSQAPDPPTPPDSNGQRPPAKPSQAPDPSVPPPRADAQGDPAPPAPSAKPPDANSEGTPAKPSVTANPPEPRTATAQASPAQPTAPAEPAHASDDLTPATRDSQPEPARTGTDAASDPQGASTQSSRSGPAMKGGSDNGSDASRDERAGG
jgi:RNA polymerase sigma factor (sigma-70 family)